MMCPHVDRRAGHTTCGCHQPPVFVRPCLSVSTHSPTTSPMRTLMRRSVRYYQFKVRAHNMCPTSPATHFKHVKNTYQMYLYLIILSTVPFLRYLM